ncbi:MAG: 16S rRNA (cytosine(1402)-N(4))-methyltransferase [Burkholderiales bacterium]|nr:16S rRNA (cytosine(1402)-N(4))-methyltransferase [Burkholderiales bacterium]
MTDATPPHKRRVRYAGTHPRQFEEKYKELDPTHHAAEVDKVMQRGQTPAGMHRSICVDEILAILKPVPGETGVDLTLGFGGHMLAMLPLVQPGGRMFGMDVDPIELPRTTARLRAAGFGEEALTVHRANFSELLTLLPQAGGGFDFALADLGVSSCVTRHRLRDLLTDNSDEPFAQPLAAALQGQFLETTVQLADLVRATMELAYKRSMPAEERLAETKKVLQRTFQALRIEVNDEFGVLDTMLLNLPACLKPGGRVAILSFHSGEDRRVKKCFQTGERNGTFSSVAADPIRASFEEQRSNPRSTSAKLRWAVRALH